MQLTNQDYHICVVVLIYNSAEDLIAVAPQIAAQTHVRRTLILVDNASRHETVVQIKTWLANWKSDAIIGTPTEIEAWTSQHADEARFGEHVYFITNNENRGYSAGNNIGLRLADILRADAVLIANPDMRLEDPLYLARLSETLFSDDANFVAASRIIGLDGENQNPLREPGFWEELLWPRFYLSKFLNPISYILPISGNYPVKVPKVSGCCLLLRMSFLRATGYLDEGVFLYCEEPILSARVHQKGGHIVFAPSLTAVHAHVRGKKDNSSRRMLTFIKSRRYYLERYSGYGRLRLTLLRLSYWILALLHTIKIQARN